MCCCRLPCVDRLSFVAVVWCQFVVVRFFVACGCLICVGASLFDGCCVVVPGWCLVLFAGCLVCVLCCLLLIVVG